MDDHVKKASSSDGHVHPYELPDGSRLGRRPVGDLDEHATASFGDTEDKLRAALEDT